MYIVDDLKIEKQPKCWRVTCENTKRHFDIDFKTLEPVDSNWFCSYETFKRIKQILEAEQKITQTEEV